MFQEHQSWGIADRPERIGWDWNTSLRLSTNIQAKRGNVAYGIVYRSWGRSIDTVINSCLLHLTSLGIRGFLMVSQTYGR
jgi:hypothetical protein